MTPTDVSLFVRTQIANHLQLPLPEVTVDKQLDLLGLDSLGALELVLTCEEEFGMPMSQDSREINIVTVGDAVDYVAGRTAEHVTTAADTITQGGAPRS